MIKLGSSGQMVSAWTALMKKRYPSYALGRDETPIKVDGYFGYDEEKVQKEYQRRTNQSQTGVVSDNDLHKLGLMPTLFTIHGTGQPDPFGIGMPADIARRCLDLYKWQPVGNYPATAIPMNKSADMGEQELYRLVTDYTLTPGPFAMIDYSQGSICGGRIRNKLRDGNLKYRYKDFIGSASFGNPMRPRGSYAGSSDPGGHGIDPVLETAAEGFCLNLAQRGDLYTTCPDGKAGEMERAIFNMIFSKFTGKDSIIEQLLQIATNPAAEMPGLIEAILHAGMFFIQNPPTGPHVTYHTKLCPGTGMTYYEYAVNHIRKLATDRLQNIIDK